MLDKLDSKILKNLTSDGRVTWAELASACGVSAPAIADRVRRLEKRGIIAGYTVQLSAQYLGYDITAFVAVSLERPHHRQGFLDYVQTKPEIQECHHVTGEGDYLLKVRCRSTAELEQIISDEIKGLAGVVQTRTSIALSTIKEGIRLPV
ncbi:MAG: Lrp/AsnC family transcriptional regulator [Cyanobacteria bacterium P01_D01_bin.44]